MTRFKFRSPPMTRARIAKRRRGTSFERFMFYLFSDSKDIDLTEKIDETIHIRHRLCNASKAIFRTLGRGLSL